jgi:hypothetical protein
MTTPNAQEDPYKDWGTPNYFRNKDNQRRVVNNMRREDRNARIMQQGLTRNIKEAIRNGEDPRGFISAAKEMGLNPVGGGGIGQEATERDAELRNKASQIFEEMDAVRRTEQRTDPSKPITPTNSNRNNNGSTVPTDNGGMVSSSPAINPANQPPGNTAAQSVDLPDNLPFDNSGSYETDLGKRAKFAFDNRKSDAEFEKGLGNAFEMAKTEKEIIELSNFISGANYKKFNSRISPELLSGAPDWAKDVKEDKTFRGQDLTRFKGMTREEAREQVMKERSSALMKSFDNQGRRIASQQRQSELNNKKMQADAERETNSYLSDAGKLGAKARIEKFGVERASEIFFNSQKLREELDNSSNLQRILLDDNNKSFPITSTNENIDMKNYQYVFNQLNKTLNPYS